MSADGSSTDNSQTAETVQRKKGRARVKARQLSRIIRQVIVDQFSATHSTEDIAEELGIPARTVTDVVIAELMRRQPQPERGNRMQPLVMRRSA